MQLNRISKYFTGNIVLTIAFCLIVLIAISYIAIYQPQKTQNKLNRKISQTGFKIAEQKKYHSLYDNLKKQLKQIEINEQIHKLPDLRNISLHQKDLKKISSIIRRIADKTGLETTSVNLDTQSLSKYESKLQINATFKGEIPEFKELVLNLGSLDYVEQFSRIKVQDIVKNKKYNLGFWISLS